MSATIQQRIALAMASILLVLAIVLVATRADDEETVALPSPTPTATAKAKAATPKPTPKPTTAAAARTAAPPTRTAPPAESPATNALRPGDAAPPKPGTYTYRERTNGETSNSTYRVADDGSGRYTETFDDELTNDVLWRPDGKFVDKTTFGNPPQGFECDWGPDILEIKLPLAAGSSWDIKGRCTPAPGMSISFDGTSRVTGTQRMSVGGTAVDTWVMVSNVTLKFTTPDGSFDQKISSDDRFSAKHGLYVRSVEKSEGTDPETGEESSETTTRELVSLTPK